MKEEQELLERLGAELCVKCGKKLTEQHYTTPGDPVVGRCAECRHAFWRRIIESER